MEQPCCSKNLPENEPTNNSSTSTTNSVTPDKRIRVGYIIQKAREYSMFNMLETLPIFHNKDEIEVFVYYMGVGLTDSQNLHGFRVFSDERHYRNISQGFLYAERLMKCDKIQILVLLNSTAQCSSFNFFNSRISPIQIIIGLEPIDMDRYFGKHIDYIITDKASQPELFHVRIVSPFEIIYSKRSIFVTDHKEKYKYLKKPIQFGTDEGIHTCSYIEQMDGTFKCCPRKMFNLPEDSIVYCNFGELSKIATNFEVIYAWRKILKRVPNSVLWLVRGQNSKESDSNNIRDIMFYICGTGNIDPQRIIISDFINRDDHILGRVPLADIFLDLSNKSSNNMSCLDAIWAGVPVVTLPSLCKTSRVAASALTEIDCKDTIADNLEDYIKIATDLGQDEVLLEYVRTKIWDSRTEYHLFDRKLFVEELETIYKRVNDKKQNEKNWLLR